MCYLWGGIPQSMATCGREYYPNRCLQRASRERDKYVVISLDSCQN